MLWKKSVISYSYLVFSLRGGCDVGGMDDVAVKKFNNWKNV